MNDIHHEKHPTSTQPPTMLGFTLTNKTKMQTLKVDFASNENNPKLKLLKQVIVLKL